MSSNTPGSVGFGEARKSSEAPSARSHATKVVGLAAALLACICSADDAHALVVTPPQNPDGAYVFSDLKEHEVRALYSILRRTNGGRGANGDSLKLSGSEIKAWYWRTSNVQDPGTNDDTAYTKNWRQVLTAEAQFKLRRTRVDSVRGGRVVDNVNGTRFAYEQTTSYVWDPVQRKLFVSIEKPVTPSSGTTLGRQTIAGTYAIEATSKVNVTTLAGSTSIVNGSVTSINPPVGSLSFGLDKVSAGQSTRVNLTIAGNPYWVDLGRLFFERRSDGTTWWELGMDVVADTDVKITRPVTGLKNCTVRYRGFAASVGIGTAAPATTPATVPNVTACNIETANFFADISYRAKPADFGDQSNEKVGQRWRARFQANKTGEQITISRLYKFASLTNWALSVQGTNTAANGFASGFDISDGEQGASEEYFNRDARL